MIRIPFAILLLACALLTGAEDALPPDSAYVTVQDGHLAIAGKRVRFWGTTGAAPTKPGPQDDPYRYNRLALDRVQAYGFNLMRIWHLPLSAVEQPDGYIKGDGSKLDVYDWFLSEAKRRGMRLWAGAAGGNGIATMADVGIIDDPATAEAWQVAVGEKGIRRLGFYEATAWDPRLQAIWDRDVRHFLDRRNQHTGLRLADDPVFAVWELTNEQWWMPRMVGGNWQKMPAFFRDQLVARWNEFLRTKYVTQEALIAAWQGLQPGEDLATGTILLAPMRNTAKAGALNDANAQADAKFDGIATTLSRDDVSPHRSRDVNEFFIGLILASKRRMAAVFKACGKGTTLSPLTWDSGIGYDGGSQVIHQNADAVSHCAYIGGISYDESNGRYPFMSGLEEPPRICLNVPWLEHNKVEGKPFFCYETNIGSPAKFRSEFPYRMLFLASIQDWDIISWHSLSGGYPWQKEDPLDGPISSPGPGAVQFNYQYDEVLISAIRAAGAMFTGLSLQPVANPTTFIYGRRTIYSPESMDYAGSYGKNGLDMLNTTYLYGCRTRIDLDREDDDIQGRTIPLMTAYHPNPLRPTGQMCYDWRKGYLQMASPAVAAFTGFLAQYGADQVDFGNGVVLRKVSVVNDPDAPYPVTPEENYVSVGLASEDGLPLADCRRAVISAVSTSNNKGLVVGRDPKAPDRPGHVWAAAKVFSGAWKKPVLFSRVDCEITAPAIAGMTYRMRDWHWQVVEEGTIGADGVLHISARKPIFLVELQR